MTDSFVDPRQLILGGERRFTAQVERLLGLLRYSDISNIDGSGDEGGDLLATIAGQTWVFQAKWQKQGSVPQGPSMRSPTRWTTTARTAASSSPTFVPAGTRWRALRFWLAPASASTSGPAPTCCSSGSRQPTSRCASGCGTTRVKRLPR